MANRTKPSLGIQLYSVRDDCAKDLLGTIKAVAAIGYAGVEFAGYFNHSAKEIRKVLDEVGIKPAGTHTGLQTLQGDEFARTVEFNKTLGNPYIVVPALPPELTKTLDDWRKMADTFTEIAGRLAKEGMKFGYHNHAAEMKPVDGVLPWNVLFDRTTNTFMQVDTGNALEAGMECTGFLKKYTGRATTVHLKEFSSTNSKAIIGEGDVKWNDVLELCETVGGTQWYIVEQESYAHTPLKCAELSFQNLRKMGR